MHCSETTFDHCAHGQLLKGMSALWTHTILVWVPPFVGGLATHQSKIAVSGSENPSSFLNAKYVIEFVKPVVTNAGTVLNRVLSSAFRAHLDGGGSEGNDGALIHRWHAARVGTKIVVGAADTRTQPPGPSLRPSLREMSFQRRRARATQANKVK